MLQVSHPLEIDSELSTALQRYTEGAEVEVNTKRRAQVRNEDQEGLDSRLAPLSHSLSGIGRRSFIQLLAACSSGLAAAKSQRAYAVGSGYSSDPYTAASRALLASGQFPTSLTGQTVIIKPNLVANRVSSTGTTTDPQVVRAIVDRSIAAGATQILIVEAFPPAKSPFWSALGYAAVFQNYPQVKLVDLRAGKYVLSPVPHGGLAYQSLWVPSLLLQPNTFFISAAKLKTHVDTAATLSMKNLVGLGYEVAYAVKGKLARQDLHYRGIDLSVVDLNLVRPVDFAVIDGVWGMQGQGPASGTPVATNVVLAGLNPVATDRVALNIMQLPQSAVPHLAYAAAAGLGPYDTSSVTVQGDSFIPYSFTPAGTPPVLWQPAATPTTISISAGGQTTIAYKIGASCYTRVEIIQDSDATPSVVLVRTLHDFTPVSAGAQSVVWDGKNDAGAPIAPGTYLARVQARTTPTSKPINYAVTRITATA